MAPRIITPPLEELTSFEAFSAAMTTAPLDDLHKTYDSDGEHDLEDNYEGDDSDEDITDEDGAQDAMNITIDPFSNSDHDSEIDMLDDTSPYEYFDPRFDVDLSKLTPGHAKSRHINPELQSMVDQTELFLEQLSFKFQPMIEEQPMSTTIVLANQAVEQVLKPYRGHGSQARLSESAMKFLAGGSRVRRPGKEGLDGSKDAELRFVEHSTDKTDRARVEKLKRKAGENVVVDDTSRKKSLKIKILKRSDGTSVIVPATPTMDVSQAVPKSSVPKSSNQAKYKSSSVNVFGERVGYGFQPASVIPLDGPKAQVDSLSFRKTSDPLEMSTRAGSSTRTSVSDKSEETTADIQYVASSASDSHLSKRPTLTINTTKSTHTKSPFTPLANTLSNINIRSPSASPGRLSQASTAYDPPDNYSCTINAYANAALVHEAYNPISMKFSWPASITVGDQSKPCMPTPNLLDAFNNIIRLYNAEGRNLLSYYIHKYDTPAELGGRPANGSVSPASPPGEVIEPPHALFRLGISQYLHSKVGKIIATKETDELGLNPEARRILRAVWERHPSINARFDDGLVDVNLSINNEKENLHPDTNHFTTFCPPSSPSPPPSSTSSFPDYDSDMDVDIDPDSPRTNADVPFHQRRNLHKFHLGLNPIEKTLLARACNVSVETVEAYWDEMREKTKAWGAMKLWCEVQSRKRIEKAKREGRW